MIPKTPQIQRSSFDQNQITKVNSLTPKLQQIQLSLLDQISKEQEISIISKSPQIQQSLLDQNQMAPIQLIQENMVQQIQAFAYQ